MLALNAEFSGFCKNFSNIKGQRSTKGEAIYENVVKHIKTLENDEIALEYAEEQEKAKNKQTTIALFTYIFCTCVYWLILAGIQSDELYSNEIILSSFGTFELLAIPTFLTIGYLEDNSPWCLARPIRVGVFAGAISIIISIVWPKEFGFELLPYRWLVSISFLICLLPILLLVFRGVFVGPYICMRKLQIKQHLKKMQPDRWAAEKWLYTENMPSIFKDVPNFEEGDEIE